MPLILSRSSVGKRQGRRQQGHRLLAKLLLLSVPLQRELTVILEPLGGEHGGLPARTNRFHQRRGEQPQRDYVAHVTVTESLSGRDQAG